MRGVIFGCIAFALPFAVQAQQACMTYEEARDFLARDYGEAVAATAIDGHGRLVIVFANAETGTWSIGLAIEAEDGGSLFCPIAGGEAFTAYPPSVAVPQGRGG